jgi:uncharacterized protein (DUF1778 family)
VYNNDMSVAHRLDMRVSDEQNRLLRQAAADAGESLTGFILSAATERARQVIGQAHRVEVTMNTFQRFVQALDEPVQDMPVLRRYARS